MLAAFLRFEQVAAYVREHAHNAGLDIRGIRRVEHNLNRHGSKVWIGDGTEHMILSDQKTYGLWGLFTVTSRVSNLIPPGPIGVTPEVEAFVEAQYRPVLARAQDALFALIAHGGMLDLRPTSSIHTAMAQVLTPDPTPAEYAFYARLLRDTERFRRNAIARH